MAASANHVAAEPSARYLVQALPRATLVDSCVLIDVLADRPHSGAAAVASLINTHADRAAVEDINDAVGGGRASRGRAGARG